MQLIIQGVGRAKFKLLCCTSICMPDNGGHLRAHPPVLHPSTLVDGDSFVTEVSMSSVAPRATQQQQPPNPTRSSLMGSWRSQLSPILELNRQPRVAPESPSVGPAQQRREAAGARMSHEVVGMRRRLASPVGAADAKYVPQQNPIMRKAGQPLPFARTGATTLAGATATRNRLSGTIPPTEALTAYRPAPPSEEESNWWIFTSRLLTCCFWSCCLTRFGKPDPLVQQAWREKVALCLIILSVMGAVALLTFGLQPSLCPNTNELDPANYALLQSDHYTNQYRDDIIIHGYIYDFDKVASRLSDRGNIVLTADWHGVDITPLFEPDYDQCARYYGPSTYVCRVPNRIPGSPGLEPGNSQPCPDYTWLGGLMPKSKAFFSWADLANNTRPPHTLVAYNGAVLNLTAYFASDPSRQFTNTDPVLSAVLQRSLGRDGTVSLSSSQSAIEASLCLRQSYIVGYVEQATIGCVAANFAEAICLSVVLCVVSVRFIMAILFHWFISHRLTRRKNRRGPAGRLLPVEEGMAVGTYCGYEGASLGHPSNVASIEYPRSAGPVLQGGSDILGRHNTASFATMPISPIFPGNGRPVATKDDHYTIMLVTCYSEGEEGIRNTLESLASTDYPDTHKLLFIIADGLITGSGNDKSTPDAIVSMIEQDEELMFPEAKSYLAIADGEKQHNMAKVYAGRYHHKCGGSVPVVVVVKCGTPAEQRPQEKKAGNRGKRDSQLILMNFLSRVMFNDRMSPLDYDLSWKIPKVARGVRPDHYTLVLMVDADTIVAPESLGHMVQVMKNDLTVMGLCGETRIANKRTSWVTAIQVFEYYISHHLGKAFESVFGGVTCLPGCFCMYRIKAPKGYERSPWLVPILANPTILDEYSENIVETLHKKNLLLLGEDRFLTTLMLRQFPKRKLIFVPQAVCRTVVPDTFSMLLSQRRRWINSTIHNLLRLVLLRDLCGVFCFSMQFVVLLELIGTIVLPAAILFVFVLLFTAMITGKVAMLPLMMMLATLGLPGLLIVVTTRKMVYLLWMAIYVVSLPVWNFILPLYAFWNFDDFSWGKTREVAGAIEGDDHGKRDGEYRPGSVSLKTWVEWEVERRQRARLHPAPLSAPVMVSESPFLEEVSTVHQVMQGLKSEMALRPLSTAVEHQIWVNGATGSRPANAYRPNPHLNAQASLTASSMSRTSAFYTTAGSASAADTSHGTGTRILDDDMGSASSYQTVRPPSKVWVTEPTASTTTAAPTHRHSTRSRVYDLNAGSWVDRSADAEPPEGPRYIGTSAYSAAEQPHAELPSFAVLGSNSASFNDGASVSSHGPASWRDSISSVLGVSLSRIMDVASASFFSDSGTDSVAWAGGQHDQTAADPFQMSEITKSSPLKLLNVDIPPKDESLSRSSKPRKGPLPVPPIVDGPRKGPLPIPPAASGSYLTSSAHGHTSQSTASGSFETPAIDAMIMSRARAYTEVGRYTHDVPPKPPTRRTYRTPSVSLELVTARTLSLPSDIATDTANNNRSATLRPSQHVERDASQLCASPEGNLPSNEQHEVTLHVSSFRGPKVQHGAVPPLKSILATILVENEEKLPLDSASRVVDNASSPERTKGAVLSARTTTARSPEICNAAQSPPALMPGLVTAYVMNGQVVAAAVEDDSGSSSSSLSSSDSWEDDDSEEEGPEHLSGLESSMQVEVEDSIDLIEWQCGSGGSSATSSRYSSWGKAGPPVELTSRLRQTMPFQPRAA